MCCRKEQHTWAYIKHAHQWKEHNDSLIRDVTWGDIQRDACLDESGQVTPQLVVYLKRNTTSTQLSAQACPPKHQVFPQSQDALASSSGDNGETEATMSSAYEISSPPRGLADRDGGYDDYYTNGALSPVVDSVQPSCAESHSLECPVQRSTAVETTAAYTALAHEPSPSVEAERMLGTPDAAKNALLSRGPESLSNIEQAHPDSSSATNISTTPHSAFAIGPGVGRHLFSQIGDATAASTEPLTVASAFAVLCSLMGDDACKSSPSGSQCMLTESHCYAPSRVPGQKVFEKQLLKVQHRCSPTEATALQTVCRSRCAWHCRLTRGFVEGVVLAIETRQTPVIEPAVAEAVASESHTQTARPAVPDQGVACLSARVGEMSGTSVGPSLATPPDAYSSFDTSPPRNLELSAALEAPLSAFAGDPVLGVSCGLDIGAGNLPTSPCEMNLGVGSRTSPNDNAPCDQSHVQAVSDVVLPPAPLFRKSSGRYSPFASILDACSAYGGLSPRNLDFASVLDASSCTGAAAFVPVVSCGLGTVANSLLEVPSNTNLCVESSTGRNDNPPCNQSHEQAVPDEEESTAPEFNKAAAAAELLAVMLAPLPADGAAAVDNAISPANGSADDKLFCAFSIDMYRMDMHTLRPLTWISDGPITFMMMLFQQRNLQEVQKARE
jgi:hypothetical protein